jgi:hypothetical protein
VDSKGGAQAASPSYLNAGPWTSAALRSTKGNGTSDMALIDKMLALPGWE